MPWKLSVPTVEAAFDLYRGAKNGDYVGIAYIALRPGRRFEADVIGECRRSPVFTLGAIPSLSEYLQSLARAKP